MALLLFCLAVGVSSVMSQTDTTLQPMTSPTTQRPYVGPNMINALNAQHVFGQAISILNQTGLTQLLLQEPAVTLFLPTNDALNKLPAGYLTKLRSDPQKLKEVFSYHVVKDSVPHLYNDLEMMSMSGRPIRVNTYNLLRKIAVEGVELTKQATRFQNGYFYGLADVMVPPEGNIVDIIQARDDMKTLNSLINKANLRDVIRNDRNITMFAPTDDAFNALNPAVLTYLEYTPDTIKEILLYHVHDHQTLYSIGMRHSMTFQSADHHRDVLILIEQGDDIYINHAHVTEKDVSATNGVMHVIDEILIPIRVTLEIENQGINIKPTAAPL